MFAKSLGLTKMKNFRRWYDKDEELQEALELLNLSTEKNEDKQTDYVVKLQEQVAADVINKIYENIKIFYGKGKRWYDNDPIMMRAMEKLIDSPPHVQRIAATKLLKALAREDSSEFEKNILKED